MEAERITMYFVTTREIILPDIYHAVNPIPAGSILVADYIKEDKIGGDICFMHILGKEHRPALRSYWPHLEERLSLQPVEVWRLR